MHGCCRLCYAAPTAAPDAADVFAVLQCGKGKTTTENQHRSNFITWAIAKAPLLLSTNLTAMAIQYPRLLKLIANPEIVAINQDSEGIQARKLLVSDAPVGKPVGVESCAAPDAIAMAATADGADRPAVYGSAAEVLAAKQRWTAVPLISSNQGGPRVGVTQGAVQLRHGFYNNRCLALQPPNRIACK